MLLVQREANVTCGCGLPPLYVVAGLTPRRYTVFVAIGRLMARLAPLRSIDKPVIDVTLRAFNRLMFILQRMERVIELGGSPPGRRMAAVAAIGGVEVFGGEVMAGFAPLRCFLIRAADVTFRAVEVRML